jgi:hypothetical protein
MRKRIYHVTEKKKKKKKKQFVLSGGYNEQNYKINNRKVAKSFDSGGKESRQKNYSKEIQ